ncbi:MAG: hypothetical protein IJO63_03680 [Bacilli bacterium]|nr:hypothetical protein [Bacilli bacterium]
MIKRNKITFIVLLISIVVFAGLIACYFFSDKPSVEPENAVMSILYPKEVTSNCLDAGKVCIGKEIIKGIKVSVPVNNKTLLDFYVLSNTPQKMTLISAENIIDDAIWYIQDTNVYGPNNLIISLLEATKNWDNIEPIKHYEYFDLGYGQYASICKDYSIENHNYDCSSLEKGAGYHSLVIENGNITSQTSFESSFILDNRKLRVRTVTKEEITLLQTYTDGSIKWLENSNKFWTLTSATEKQNGYNAKAYAVRSAEFEDSGIQLHAYDVDHYDNIGIRAVIELEKR